MTTFPLHEHAERVAPRHSSPYSVNFPDLSSIHPTQEGSGRPLKVCIATEDIVGPIRNGGIGTTYTHLSFMLAQEGHDVSIFYLRGKHAEGNDIDYWINWYRERGVRFVPVDVNLNLQSPATRWIRPMLALYRRLREEHFDVVHASEWRGAAYLSMLAKKQGLAFEKTIFCIKTSSPWLWNRETCLRPLEEASDLIKIFAERRSVELADLVVGGSSYLLRWMLAHGYRLPEGRTYSQPNVVKPVELPDELTANRPEYGSRVKIREIVFFGRLEHRKGLEIFCEAINNLRRENVKLPPITFMGKFGSRIPSHADISIEEFIKLQTRAFNVQIKILPNKNQFEGLSYLHREGVLAVMPSLAENSTLAVYETTHFAIPFIASDVGGTSELIASEHRESVLVDAHPWPLTEKLRDALNIGGFVAAPSFDNSSNLETWKAFHRNLVSILDNNDLDLLNLKPFSSPQVQTGDPFISVCLIFRDDQEKLDRTLTRLSHQVDESVEIILVNDGSETKAALSWLNNLNQYGEVNNRLILKHISRQGAPQARNLAASIARGEYLLFIDTDAHPEEHALELLTKVASNSRADLFLPYYHEATNAAFHSDKPIKESTAFLSGDPSFSFYEPESISPMLAVRRSVFTELGGFTTDYKIPGAMEEFVNKATLNDNSVECIPEYLAIRIKDYPKTERIDEAALQIRSIRPHIESTPLCLQPLLLMAKAEGSQRQILSQFGELLRGDNTSSFGDEDLRHARKVFETIKSLSLENEERRKKAFDTIIENAKNESTTISQLENLSESSELLHKELKELRQLCFESILRNAQRKPMLRFLPRKEISPELLTQLQSKLGSSDQIYLIAMLQSKSWKITMPIRLMARLVLRSKPTISYQEVLTNPNPSQLRDLVEQSWSWRISAPLRRAQDFVERIKSERLRNK